MKKFFLFLAIILVALIAILAFAWMSKTSIVAHRLSKELGVPVTIKSLVLSQKGANINELWIGNPSRSNTKTAFSCKHIDIITTLKEIRGNPLTIEEILMEDIFIGIEKYSNAKKDTNWSQILKPEDTRNKQGSRDYVIQKFVVRNLNIQLTKADGKVQTFPAIAEMTFYNITSESGFPVKDIEKAILDKMLKEALLKFNLNEILDTLIPTGSPLKYIPLFN